MDSGSAFFAQALVLQFVFTAAVIALVARRYPARLPVYRFVVPGAVPVLLFAFASYAYVQLAHYQGLTIGWEPLGRLALAYAVLWLVGVLGASLVARLARRRR